MNPEVIKNPLITIGLPVYNGGNYLESAIESLLRQEYKNFEIIISDNASNDNTEELCLFYAKKDKRIKYHRQDRNIDTIENFKWVLDQASSQYYFMWAAADDKRSPDFLSLALRVMDENPDVGLVFCDFITTNLISGNFVKNNISFSVSEKSLNRLFFRLKNECPSLIYGLHRIHLLKKINIESYDFFDVFLSHWYEINSRIKIIPLILYEAGTFGVRIPYSLTHKYINIKSFMSAEWSLLRSKENLFKSFVFWIIILILYKLNQIRLNRFIRENK
jgi:glycosyltransferase involved in cell wall biosynthesis